MSNSKPLEPQGVLFLDRTHQSKIAMKLLNALGCSIERHRTHFLPEAPDDEWIPVCAEKNWIIISGDKGLIRDGINRAAVQQSKAKVFILADTDGKGADWAASIALAARKILAMAHAHHGPFYCNVARGADSHVGRVEYLAGGGPVLKQSTSELAIPAVEDSSRLNSQSPRPDPTYQPNLPFAGKKN